MTTEELAGKSQNTVKVQRTCGFVINLQKCATESGLLGQSPPVKGKASWFHSSRGEPQPEPQTAADAGNTARSSKKRRIYKHACFERDLKHMYTMRMSE